MFSQGKDSTPGAVEEKPRVAFLGDPCTASGKKGGAGGRKGVL